MSVESGRAAAIITDKRIIEIMTALDAGIDALRKLSKTGSLRKEIREDALARMWSARQDKLFEED